MPVAEKTQDTETRLQEAQARVAALQAEASGLPEQMRQALAAGKKDRYLDLMVRENAIPNVIR
jgi:hypothetical protein